MISSKIRSGFDFFGQTFIKLEAAQPGGIFQGPVFICARIFPMTDGAGNVQFLCQLLDKFLVGVSAPVEVMIKMGDVQMKTQFILQTVKNVGKGYGIRPSGDSDDNGASGAEKAGILNVLFNFSN